MLRFYVSTIQGRSSCIRSPVSGSKDHRLWLFSGERNSIRTLVQTGLCQALGQCWRTKNASEKWNSEWVKMPPRGIRASILDPLSLHWTRHYSRFSDGITKLPWRQHRRASLCFCFQKEISGDEIQPLAEKLVNKNAIKTTKTWINVWKMWATTKGLNDDILKYNAKELNEHLSRFAKVTALSMSQIF